MAQTWHKTMSSCFPRLFLFMFLFYCLFNQITLAILQWHNIVISKRKPIGVHSITVNQRSFLTLKTDFLLAFKIKLRGGVCPPVLPGKRKGEQFHLCKRCTYGDLPRKWPLNSKLFLFGRSKVVVVRCEKVFLSF